MSYDCVPSSTNSTADTTVTDSAAPETNTPVDESIINSVTTQINLHVVNPIAYLNKIFEKNDNVSTESSKRKLTSRKYSLRKSTLASGYSNSLPQSEVQQPKPCNEEDIREERVRYFMETWSEIKFDSKNNLFIGRNKEECLNLDIDAVRAFDKDGLIETIDLESLKTSRKDQWVELPISYKTYINKYAKELVIFEGLFSQR